MVRFCMNILFVPAAWVLFEFLFDAFGYIVNKLSSYFNKQIHLAVERFILKMHQNTTN